MTRGADSLLGGLVVAAGLGAAATILAVAIGVFGHRPDIGRIGSAVARTSFAPSSPPAPPVVSDYFDTGVIDHGVWTVANPQAGTIEADPSRGALLKVLPGAASFVPTMQAPALLQVVANVDLSVEARFDSQVGPEPAEQGMVIMQDSASFLRVGIRQDATRTLVSALWTSGGRTTELFQMAVRNGANFFLRVHREGSIWSISWSYDGQAWTPAHAFAQVLTMSRIGLYAAGSSPGSPVAAPFVAKVDYFRTVPGTSSGAIPNIDLWYGPHETFGAMGWPQSYVNVLGNVSDPNGIDSLSYSLNGQIPAPLAVGEDGARLSSPGDFNAEIPYTELRPGPNTVVITAVGDDGRSNTSTVTLNDASTGGSWPQSYTVDWNSVTDPNRVAQVVDGKWAVQPGGTIRTLQPGYDRLLDIGDMTAWSSYRVTVEVTVNAVPPGGGAFAVGPVFGWQGHTVQDQSTSPAIGHPFSAWFNWSGGGQQTQSDLSIYANSIRHHEVSLATGGIGDMQVGKTYEFEAQATTNADGGTSHYAFKVWPKGSPEPANWLLQSDGDLNQGSVLLASYWADVSYGAIDVTGLAPAAPSEPLPVGTPLGPWTVVQSAVSSADSPGFPSATIPGFLPRPTRAGDQIIAVVAGSAEGTPPSVEGPPLSGFGPITGPTRPGDSSPFLQVMTASAVPSGRTSFPLSVTNGPQEGQFDTVLLIEVSGPQLLPVWTGGLTGDSVVEYLPSGARDVSIGAEAWTCAAAPPVGPAAAQTVTVQSGSVPMKVWLGIPVGGVPVPTGEVPGTGCPASATAVTLSSR